MTREWYISNGFNLSVEQPIIDRAETDVVSCYIRPLSADADITDKDVQPLASNLAYLLVLQRNTRATRKGAKVETDENSMQATWQETIAEQAGICQVLLTSFAKAHNAQLDSVKDICLLKLKTRLKGI